MKNRLMTAAAIAAGTLLASPAFAVCDNCGTVTDVKSIKKEGEASGGGAIIGGVVGGVLGHQVGSGRGKDVATVAGAAGGAYAGHQVEKSAKSSEFWQVSVKMDGGNMRYFNFDKEPSYRAGDTVKIVDKKLVRQ